MSLFLFDEVNILESIMVVQTEPLPVDPLGAPAGVRVESPVVVFLLAIVDTQPGAVKTDVLQVRKGPDTNDHLTAEPTIASGGQIDLL